MAIPDQDREVLAPHEVAAASLEDWRLVSGRLMARFSTGTFVRGVALIDRIAGEAEAAGHHPDVDLRYGHVDVSLMSHDVQGITRRDVRLARAVSDIAAQMGVDADPDAVGRD